MFPGRRAQGEGAHESELPIGSAKTAGRLSTLVAKTKAKVRPRLPHGGTVLSGVRLAATVAGKLGSSIPYMKGIVDAGNEVVGCAEGMKNNRKECKKIAELTEELVKGILAGTEGVEENDLGERSRLNLAELEWQLETIGKAMTKMRKAALIRRLLSKDEHAAQLVEHRRTLQDALAKFQMMQSIRVDLGIARVEKKQDMLLHAFLIPTTRSPGRPVGQSVPSDRVGWPSAAVTLRRSQLFFLLVEPLSSWITDC